MPGWKRYQFAALLVAAGLSLAACGGSADRPDATATPSLSMPSVPTAAPTPEASADPRSPEALAAQLTFTSPPQDDPEVQSAIDGYQEFVRQFIIAEGLGDPDYPPLLALINPQDPTFVTAVVSGVVNADDADVYVLGVISDRVTDAAGNASRVFIDTCTDYSSRKLYNEATDEFREDVAFKVVRARIVMTRAADGWILSDYSAPEEQNCP